MTASQQRIEQMKETRLRVVVAGGGASGFFAAIACSEANPCASVVVLEKSHSYLSKVRISGGGRCNVTHACFDPRELAGYYPRGAGALQGAFRRFQPRDTVAWFESRGVRLKTEGDRRMFPASDSSSTIIECLLDAARTSGVSLRAGTGLEAAVRRPDGRFDLRLSDGTALECERLMLATGGCRAASGGDLAVSLGHTLVAPVPSLFAFHLQVPWVRELAGIAVENVEISAPSMELRQRGAILFTHSGLSGPAVLKLSAWGARPMHQANYRFDILINWLPHMNAQDLAGTLQSQRAAHPARLVANSTIPPLPSRLWQRLVEAAGIPPETRWAELSRPALHRLVLQISRTALPVSGKSLNKDEFVTCGGVPLGEINFKTMESRRCPGLYFGGELLDMDGLTGGFNFQAAWTTGWIAGKAIASSLETAPV